MTDRRDPQIRETIAALALASRAAPTFEEIVDAQPAEPRPRRAWIVAVATAVAVLVVIGAASVLLGGSDGAVVPPVDSTTVPPDSTTVPPDSTTVPPDTVGLGLGTLTWERVDGDRTSIPEGISGYADGQYIAYSRDGTWTSPDAITWTFEETDAFGDYQWFDEEGDWATASVWGRTDLFRKVGETWVHVDLPAPALPDIAGVAWLQIVQTPVESGGTLVADATGWGDIAWGEVFGTFDVPADVCEPQPCVLPPHGMWQEASETLRIENPADGTVLALADVVVDGEDVLFVDRETKDIIHTVRGGPGYPPNRIVEQVKKDGERFLHLGGFVSTDDGETWSWTEFPWESHAVLLGLPDGGFGSFVFSYDWWQDPDNPLVAAEVWTSDDGLAWTAHGAPDLDLESTEYVHVQRSADQVLATVVTALSYGETAYASTNGLDWEPVDLPFTSWHEEHEATFGTVITSSPQTRWLFWVSTDDGSVWHEVEGPPGPHSPSGAGYSDAGAAGDILFLSVGAHPDGERTLWIGRFEP